MQKSLTYISGIAVAAAATVAITAFTKVPADADMSTVQLTIEEEIAAERRADLAAASMQGVWLDPDDIGGTETQTAVLSQ